MKLYWAGGCIRNTSKERPGHSLAADRFDLYQVWSDGWLYQIGSCMKWLHEVAELWGADHEVYCFIQAMCILAV